MDVQKTFDDIAQVYDQERRALIPCFDEFYGAAVESLPFKTEENFQVLDLGAGTGLLSQFILTKFPNAQVTLLDFASEMLAQAQRRFATSTQVQYCVADYIQSPLPGNYDAIVSSLSIHHLKVKEKKELFAKIFGALRAGGIFVNADNVKGPTPALDKLYKEQWTRQVLNSGLKEEQIQSAFKRTKIDRLSPLAYQMKWLKQVGFVEVDCIYKNFQRAVFVGAKK